MQDQGVPDVAVAVVMSNDVPDAVVAPNIVPGVAASVIPDVAANVIPEVATNVVPEVAADVVPEVAANVIPEVALNTHQAAWPVETDVIFVSGTTRVLLTNQSPIMRSIIQDALENIRVFLLFNNAFPNAITIPSITRNAMVAVAETRQSSSRIYQRLLNDEDYVTIMNRLVSHYDYK